VDRHGLGQPADQLKPLIGREIKGAAPCSSRAALLNLLNQGFGQEAAGIKMPESPPGMRKIRFHEFIEFTDDLVTQVDNKGRFLYVNQSAEKIFGLTPADCLGLAAFDFIHPDDRERTIQSFNGWLSAKQQSVSIENRQVNKDGTIFHMHWRSVIHYDRQGEISYINGIARDITELRDAEKELQRLKGGLERLVEERTKTLDAIVSRLEQEIVEHQNTSKLLRQRDRDLRFHAESLEESNAAMRALLKRRDLDKAEFIEDVRANLRNMVFPYLLKLQKTNLTENQKCYVQRLESSLPAITGNCSGLLSVFSRFTPTELQVANLIRQGQTSKEIASLLEVSTRTVETHRNNIRKKIGIQNKKESLRSALLSSL